MRREQLQPKRGRLLFYNRKPRVMHGDALALFGYCSEQANDVIIARFHRRH